MPNEREPTWSEIGVIAEAVAVLINRADLSHDLLVELAGLLRRLATMIERIMLDPHGDSDSREIRLHAEVTEAQVERVTLNTRPIATPEQDPRGQHPYSAEESVLIYEGRHPDFEKNPESWEPFPGPGWWGGTRRFRHKASGELWEVSMQHRDGQLVPHGWAARVPGWRQ